MKEHNLYLTCFTFGITITFKLMRLQKQYEKKVIFHQKFQVMPMNLIMHPIYIIQRISEIKMFNIA